MNEFKDATIMRALTHLLQIILQEKAEERCAGMVKQEEMMTEEESLS